MPNTTPIPELIAIELESRLNTILLENGYSFDVTEVVRPKRRGENWLYKHNGIGIRQGESMRVPELDCPGNPPAVAWATMFVVTCVSKDSENETQPHATNSNEMAAAAIQAITSVDSWHTMGDVAFDADIQTLEPFDSPEGEMDGTNVPIQVTYRVSENNPFEVRA
jgi:hypothetical protein